MENAEEPSSLNIRNDEEKISRPISIFSQDNNSLLKEKSIEDLIPLISQYITDHQGQAFSIVAATVQTCLSKGKSIKEITPLISQCIANNQGQAFKIMNAIVQTYLLKEKSIKEITPLISQCIANNQGQAFEIMNATVQACLLKEKSIKEIIPLIAQCITDHQGQAFEIMDATVQTCLLKEKSIKEIIPLILKCITNNKGQAFSIMNATVKAYLSKGNSIKEIAPLILKCITNNKGQALEIMNATVQACLSQGKSIDDISLLISQCITYNQGQAFYILDATVQACLSQGKSINEIENIFKSSFELPVIKENITEFKEMIFINSLNFSLANNKFEKEQEKEFCKYYNKNLKIANKPDYSEFNQIPLAHLKEINDNYLKYSFKKNTINGSRIEDTYLKIFLESKTEEEIGNKSLELLVEENKTSKKLICKDFYEGEIEDNKKLFKLVGLEEGDFNKGNKDDNYTVVDIVDGGHAFLLIIDRTKSYEKSKNSNCVKILDSSAGFDKNGNSFTAAQAKKINLDFYNNLDFLNKLNYQKNGTCNYQASSATSTIIRKCKKFEDIENEFEVQPGYCLSPLLTEILDNLYFKYNSLADEENIKLLSDETKNIKKEYKILEESKKMLQDDIINKLNQDLNKQSNQPVAHYGVRNIPNVSHVESLKNKNDSNQENLKRKRVPNENNNNHIQKYR